MSAAGVPVTVTDEGTGSMAQITVKFGFGTHVRLKLEYLTEELDLWANYPGEVAKLKAGFTVGYIQMTQTSIEYSRSEKGELYAEETLEEVLTI